MVKKISVQVVFSFIVVSQLLFSSDHEFEKMSIKHIEKTHILDTTIAHLAQQLEPLNEMKIKDYQWQNPNDYIYTQEPVHRDKKIIIGTIMQQLLAHRHSDKRLSTIATPQDELTIQESFFNILLTSRCAEEETAKQWYDQVFGPGEFHKKYGNYKKSILFNPAHKFAKTVWHSEMIDPHHLSINNLARISQMSMNTTADTWMSIKEVIDEKINERIRP